MSEAQLVSTINENVIDENYLIDNIPAAWVTDNGLNILTAAALPLILLLTQLRSMTACDNPLRLRNQAVREIADFEVRAKNSGCTPRSILAARYCLCTALDEFALCTHWGSNSPWSQQTLLSLIHKETWGGERFFIILEKMAEDVSQNLDLLELIYLIISLGYEGKYYNHDRMVREEVKHRLFRIIEMHRGQSSHLLSPTLSILGDKPDKIKKPLSARHITLVTSSILLILWLGFNYLTYRNAKDTLQQLKSLEQITGKVIPLQKINSVNNTYIKQEELN